VRLSGRPGAGKSATAARIVHDAADYGWQPLLIHAPSQAPDAGILAVLGIVHRLGGPDAAHGGWDAVCKRAADLLHERRGDVILVADEPSRWDAAGGMFARRANEAAQTLWGTGATWPTIICDQPRGPGALILPDTSPADLGGDWGPLQDGAERLLHEPIAALLTSPLSLRLAVAVAAWGDRPQSADAHRLGMQLAQLLPERRHGPRLWALWQRLALSRTTVPFHDLVALGSDQLSDKAVATARVALLDGAGRLHDVLRTVPEDHAIDPMLAAQQRIDAHERLYDYHHQRFQTHAQASYANDPDEAGRSAAAAAEHATEALHHAGELGDETRLDLISVDLAEQLDALGHLLGIVHKDHEAAITIYERALLADNADAHAIHHLAFHRDALGEQPAEVVVGYARAARIRPGEPQWHARRVAFLADTARMSEARLAWSEAESALAEDRGDQRIYGDLHLPVAASLLALGELAFCAYVLDGVPDHAQDAVYRDLERLLEGRFAGQDGGAFVPAPRSGRDWWTERPTRLPDRDTEGRTRVAWLAGRVERVHSDGVDLHVARVDRQRGPHGTGLMRLSHDDLAQRLIDDSDPSTWTDGRFVEIGSYRHPERGDRTGIVLLDTEPVSLPIDTLPPDRWRQQRMLAIAAAHTS
jgi:hypothetical protein